MSGILKSQLFNLEKQAETLEKIIYSDLKALESLPDSRVEQYEPKVWKKLEKLDEMQDEIDAVVAKLKEAGMWEPVSYTDAKYRYMRPKAPPKPPKEPKKPRKVYPTETTAQKRKRLAEAERKAAREARAAAKAARIAKVKSPKPKPEPKAVSAPKPAPKPRKPAESREVVLAKKRRDNVIIRLERLDDQIAAERLALLKRLEERNARVAYVAVTDTGKWWNQDKRSARLALENVEGKLAGLDKRRREREETLQAQLDKAIDEITVLEKHSQ